MREGRESDNFSQAAVLSNRRPLSRRFSCHFRGIRESHGASGTQDEYAGESVVKKLLFVFLAIAALSTLAPAEELLNLENGVAIQGYDPVALFSDNRPVK